MREKDRLTDIKAKGNKFGLVNKKADGKGDSLDTQKQLKTDSDPIAPTVSNPKADSKKNGDISSKPSNSHSVSALQLASQRGMVKEKLVESDVELDGGAFSFLELLIATPMSVAASVSSSLGSSISEVSKEASQTGSETGKIQGNSRAKEKVGLPSPSDSLAKVEPSKEKSESTKTPLSDKKATSTSTKITEINAKPTSDVFDKFQERAKSHSNHPSVDKSGNPADEMPLMSIILRYCPMFRTYVPHFAVFCDYCNRIALNRDHHCPYIGACIGFFNLKFFVLFAIGCI